MIAKSDYPLVLADLHYVVRNDDDLKWKLSSLAALAGSGGSRNYLNDPIGTDFEITLDMLTRQIAQFSRANVTTQTEREEFIAQCALYEAHAGSGMISTASLREILVHLYQMTETDIDDIFENDLPTAAMVDVDLILYTVIADELF